MPPTIEALPESRRMSPPDGHSLVALAARLPGSRLHGPNTAARILSLATHTAHIRPGALFFCLAGSAQDGHRWAPLAVEKGAAALVVERYLPECAGTPQLQVADGRQALAHLARSFHGQPDRRLLVLAVTGTNGKTTTTHMLQAIFAAAGRPLGLLGTVAYRLGDRELPSALTTPDPSLLYALLAEVVRAGLCGVALEASSHALAQQRLAGLEVDTAIFTNLTRDHLDYHGSYTAYLEAKQRLFTPRDGDKPFPTLAVVCTDQAPGQVIAAAARAAGRSVITFGLRGAPDMRGHHRVDARGRSLLEVDGAWGHASLALPLPGRYNAQNALAALTAAVGNGVPLGTAGAAVASLPPVPGRFEELPAPEGPTVVVDFAHNPDGLRSALLAARHRAAGRLHLVFGCKGNDGDRAKRVRMGQLAGCLADLVTLTTDDPYDEDPAAIAACVEEGLRRGRAAYRLLLDRRTAIRRAILEAAPKDLVLVAGRGHETQQPVCGRQVPLEDRSVCREALAERIAGLAADTVARPG